MNHCVRHYEEPLMAHCRACGRPYCNRCLVYSFGPSKPPFCVGCALVASGVRNGGKSMPAMPLLEGPSDSTGPAGPTEESVLANDRRAERAYKRAEKAAQRAQVKASKKAAKKGDGTVAPPLPPSRVPASSGVVPAPSSLMAGHDQP